MKRLLRFWVLRIRDKDADGWLDKYINNINCICDERDAGRFEYSERGKNAAQECADDLNDYAAQNRDFMPNRNGELDLPLPINLRVELELKAEIYPLPNETPHEDPEGICVEDDGFKFKGEDTSYD